MKSNDHTGSLNVQVKVILQRMDIILSKFQFFQSIVPHDLVVQIHACWLDIGKDQAFQTKNELIPCNE